MGSEQPGIARERQLMEIKYPEPEKVSRRRIRGMVKYATSQVTHVPVPEINRDTPLSTAQAHEVLALLGNDLDREIPMPRRKRRGIKVSTLEGFVFHGQEKFPKC